MQNKAGKNYIITLISRVSPVGHCLAFLTLAGVYLFNTSRCFDITDESFAILWARQPEGVTAVVTQFGYYTRLLYLLVDGDIAGFRLIGIVFLLAAALFFSHSFINYLRLNGKITITNGMAWSIMALAGSTSLVYYRSWLITPNYNWLALLATLICGAGLLRVVLPVEDDAGSEKLLCKDDVAGIISISLGGFLGFMAKPTTALVLVVASLFWLIVQPLSLKRKALILSLSALIAFGMLAGHIFFYHGDVFSFIDVLRRGMETGKLLGGGHTLSHLFVQAGKDLKSLPLRIWQISPLFYIIPPFVFFAVTLAGIMKFWKFSLCKADAFLVSSIIYFAYLFYRLWLCQFFSLPKGAGFAGLCLAVAALLLSLIFIWLFRARINKVSCRPTMVLWVLLILLACAYAFGSGNGLLRQMTSAYIFLSLAVLCCCLWIGNELKSSMLTNSLSVFFLLSVASLVHYAYQHPYRQPGPVGAQNTLVSFQNKDGRLQVTETTARYIKTLQEIAIKAGWRAGTPLIDMTGGTPGASVILQAEIVGTPWLLGAYKGSNAFAEKAINSIGKEKRCTAWILTTPKGKIRLSNNVLENVGLDFPTNYTLAGTITTGWRNEQQYLWKPK